jgi:hypothetical protein
MITFFSVFTLKQISMVLLGLVFAIFLLWYLWNSTFPELFNFKKISFFQAFKILLLSMLLTGGGTSFLSFTSSKNESTSISGTSEAQIKKTFEKTESIKLGK